MIKFKDMTHLGLDSSHFVFAVQYDPLYDLPIFVLYVVEVN